ncbi:MAG TPA: tetratricopeptide repeat protein [Polyangiaceae bacterium]|nr:tetratricopeptide repeat protein [Polyangiaceae bacterium]
MTAQTPRATEDGVTSLIARLRAEHASQTDRSLQALLQHEIGVLEETGAEEAAAVRDYLGAFNADPQLREPLEQLLRILQRRKSVKNLGKLLDALTRSADSPEERARAYWERAAFAQDYEQNLGTAKDALQEAVASNPEDATPWLELELLAGKDGDVPARMRAIEARAELATDPTWKGLLLIDLADLTAASGDVGRALDLLDAAAALDGRARFRTQLKLEALAARENDVKALSRALEGQADILGEAIDDPATAEAMGVPRYMRKPEYAADAWLRAADIKKRSGDLQAWATFLQRAADRLPESPVIARARIGALEITGDAETAAQVAKRELERGATGPGAASLWLRAAEAAALAGDRDAALSALRSAIAADPECIPARALELDLLGDAQDPGALAKSLEALAAAVPTEDAKARAFVLAAFVHAYRAGDSESAKRALEQAGTLGVPAGVLAHLARSFAALRGDAAWYEEATRALLAAGPEAGTEIEPGDKASLWLELGRSRLLRGDQAGALEAFASLSTFDAEDGAPGKSAWLGHVLSAYGIGLLGARAPEGEAEGGAEAAGAKPRSFEPIEALASVEPGPEAARGLWLVAALRRARSGDVEGARARLRSLHEQAPSDEVVAVLLAELERRTGNPVQAAATLSACGVESDDTDLRAALHIEAAILLWHAGERARAVEELESARGTTPKAGTTLLGWALRGVGSDTIEGRRRALEVAVEAGAERVVVALERFGLEAGSGDTGDSIEALNALETVEAQAIDDLEVAAALGRLLWPQAMEQRQALDQALSRLEQRGDKAKALVAAERFRLARVLDQDRAQASERAAAWVEAEPRLHSALEWLGAAMAAEDREAEISARRVIASRFDGEVRGAIEASAATVAMLEQPGMPQRLVGGDSVASQLMNIELAPPGCDPRRRAAALKGLNGALGDDAATDALALAAWSDLAAGANDDAFAGFKRVTEARPEDIASWEGVRSAAEALGDYVQTALATAQLGELCADDARGAEFWEKAGLILLDKTDAHDDAELSFERAFARDPKRGVAFDKLFRRVRARNEDDKLLEIISRRLEVADEDAEIGKLYWERARVLRKKKDIDGALEALESVTMLEPDHVGALALSGEIYIMKGDFAQAAPLLGKLATVTEAPQQQRLMSGIAAVDLYENKLGQPERALDVLVSLHKAGLSTNVVRERLARVAAKTGSWPEATSILETLMREREKKEGRIEAARLAMAIYRDKTKEPLKAEAAVAKLLEEAPDEGEAIDLVLTTNFDAAFRTRVLGRAKSTLIGSLAENPTDAERVALLAKIAGAGQDAALRQATLGTLVALGRNDTGVSDELVKIDKRVPARPQIALDAPALAEIADPEDTGPIAELMALMAETVSLALGPSLASLNVGKRERIDPRGGHPLRVAVSEWMGALGFGDFDIYIGGPDPEGVSGVAGEQPALVLGASITAPLSAKARSAIAREVFALRRGITSVRTRDDAAIASLVVASCQEAGLNVPAPQYAVFGEVSRAIHKEMPRKVKKVIPDVCQRITSSGQDARKWAQAARRSIDRMAVIAAGDVSIVLSDVLGAPRNQLEGLIADNERATRLLGFVLSPSYLELRKKLGMGVR